ncbi:MAG: hypothetical protein DRP08_08010 [Candidatus Aenigmatarchaeota archaeon]|nr:MAG: hypothetical protein DRP08_08010 [Candidatus Aenigmarchaeota archaeon]
MTGIDFLTATGIAAFVGVIVQMIKMGIQKRINISEKTRKILVIIIVCVLCLACSWITWFSDMIENETVTEMFMRAGQAAFMTIGGYEGIKQIAGLFITPKKEV